MDMQPKALRYTGDLAAVERRIVDALPEIIDGLIARAKEGDTKAALYLVDRVLGKTVGAKIAPADDRKPPYSEEDYEIDRQSNESDRDMRRLLL
jgi:hypothetical protein